MPKTQGSRRNNKPEVEVVISDDEGEDEVTDSSTISVKSQSNTPSENDSSNNNPESLFNMDNNPDTNSPFIDTLLGTPLHPAISTIISANASSHLKLVSEIARGLGTADFSSSTFSTSFRGALQELLLLSKTPLLETDSKNWGPTIARFLLMLNQRLDPLLPPLLSLHPDLFDDTTSIPLKDISSSPSPGDLTHPLYVAGQKLFRLQRKLPDFIAISLIESIYSGHLEVIQENSVRWMDKSKTDQTTIASMKVEARKDEIHRLKKVLSTWWREWRVVLSQNLYHLAEIVMDRVTKPSKITPQTISILITDREYINLWIYWTNIIDSSLKTVTVQFLNSFLKQGILSQINDLMPNFLASMTQFDVFTLSPFYLTTFPRANTTDFVTALISHVTS